MSALSSRPLTLDVGLGSPLLLPCGQVIPNRIAKPAMTECFADPATNLPNVDLNRLYARWASGGVGLIISGNVMVDRRYLESPRNVAMEIGDLEEEKISAYKEWAKACKQNNTDTNTDTNSVPKTIVQISHPGRQCPMSANMKPVCPTGGKAPKLAGLPGMFAPVCRPRALRLDEIDEIVTRFKNSALVAKQAGFDGVQIHAAHGYLLSQFLSPKINKRTDKYGGSLENRSRLLFEIVRQVRRATGPQFIIAIKLNSEDFAVGGFSKADSISVIRGLNSPNPDSLLPDVDFFEISGGTYENMESMKGTDCDGAVRESTRRREAFFIQFCEAVRNEVPDAILMLSGGWRQGNYMHSAINNRKLDIIGIARPLCLQPDLPRILIQYSSQLSLSSSSSSVQVDNDNDNVSPSAPSPSLHVNTPIPALNKTLDAALETMWHQAQMRRLASGLNADIHLGGWWYMLSVVFARAYIWDPWKKPRQTKFIVRGIATSFTIGLALACAFLMRN